MLTSSLTRSPPTKMTSPTLLTTRDPCLRQSRGLATQSAYSLRGSTEMAMLVPSIATPISDIHVPWGRILFIAEVSESTEKPVVYAVANRALMLSPWSAMML